MTEEHLDPDGWITLDEWCEKYSEQANTIHKRVADGNWVRGVFVSVPDGAILYIHEQTARAWMEKRGKLREPGTVQKL